MTATQNASKCQDSGQMVLTPVTSQCGHLTARCGCCSRDVFVVIRPGDGNEIPHYADHAGSNAITTGRQDTIRRAIALIDTAGPDDLARYLASTHLRDHIKANPAILRQHLVDATDPDADTGSRFGGWKAAQQLLQAAGLPY